MPGTNNPERKIDERAKVTGPPFQGMVKRGDISAIPKNGFDHLENVRFSADWDLTPRDGMTAVNAGAPLGDEIDGIYDAADLGVRVEGAGLPVPTAGDRFFGADIADPYLGELKVAEFGSGSFVTMSAAAVGGSIDHSGYPIVEESSTKRVIIPERQAVVVGRQGQIIQVTPNTGSAYTLFAAPAIVTAPDTNDYERNVGACLSEDKTKLYAMKEVYITSGGTHVGSLGGFCYTRTFKLCTYNLVGTLLTTEVVYTDDANSTQFKGSQESFHLAEIGGILYALAGITSSTCSTEPIQTTPLILKRDTGTWSVETLPAPPGPGALTGDILCGSIAVIGTTLYATYVSQFWNGASWDLYEHIYRNALVTGVRTWNCDHTLPKATSVPAFGSGVEIDYPKPLAVVGSTLYYAYREISGYAPTANHSVLGKMIAGVYTDAVLDFDSLVTDYSYVVNIASYRAGLIAVVRRFSAYSYYHTATPPNGFAVMAPMAGWTQSPFGALTEI